MGSNWELLRNALSQNEPIVLPKNKINQSATFYNLKKPGQYTNENASGQDEAIPAVSIATIRTKLGRYLQNDKLTFHRDMTRVQVNNAVLLWASTEYNGPRPTNPKKGQQKRGAPENNFDFEACLIAVFITFQRADSAIKEIHAANGITAND